jgi:hypothetical protein
MYNIIRKSLTEFGFQYNSYEAYDGVGNSWLRNMLKTTLLKCSSRLFWKQHECVSLRSGCNTETLYLVSFRSTLHKTSLKKLYHVIRQPYPTCNC